MRKTLFGVWFANSLLVLLVVFPSCTKKEKEAVTTRFPVKRGTLLGKLEWRGSVRSANRIEIRAQSRVKIAKFSVKNFEMVKKGQLLLEVDRSEGETKRNDIQDRLKTQELEMSSSRTKLSFNARALERKRTLFGKGIISQKDFEEARREHSLSENDTKAKELDLDKTRRELAELEDTLKTSNFLAPMDGLVSGLVSGDNSSNPEVQAGQLLATVSDPKVLALSVRVEESSIHRLSQGMPALVKIDALPQETFPGKILEISTSSAQGDNSPGNISPMKSYDVSIAFNTGKSAVQEGFSGIGSLVYAEKKDALSVPLLALRYLDGKDFLLSASDLTSPGKPTSVQIGLKTENEAEVLSGVTENTYVVVEAE